MKTVLFIIFELDHVSELKKYFEKKPEEKETAVVVACAIDIEEQLMKEGISFTSAGNYKKTFAEQLSNEDEMMEKFFRDPRWKEFVFRGIELPRIFQFMFRAYLQVVRYYARLLTSIVESHPGAEIKIFSSGEVIGSTHGTLAYREIHAIVDCAKRIGVIKNIQVEVLPPSIVHTAVRNRLRAHTFSLKREVFGILLKLWNTAVRLISSPRPPRFLVSDHWRNIKSSIELMKSGELIFLDRTEIVNINLRNLLRYRMRFVHITDFLTKKGRESVRENSAMLCDKWLHMKESFPEIFSWDGMSFDELLLCAVDDITLDFPRILAQIEGTYAMYEKIRPQAVHLRASVSKQTHFSILAMVAKKVGIPSLELQHGLEYLGPGSWSREHEAEHIALYGSLVKKEMMALGYREHNLALVGSPRFDKNISLVEEYRKKRSDEKITVLCIAPDIRFYEVYDSYSARDYFTSAAEALRGLKDRVHVIIKIRPGPAHETLLRTMIDKAFTGYSYRIAHNEPLSAACKDARIAISCFSTALLEALQFEIPVVLQSLHPVDAEINTFHFKDYEAGVVTMAYTQEEFAEILSELIDNPQKLEEASTKIRSFMSRNYSFDGTSSERYATLMTQLAEQVTHL